MASSAAVVAAKLKKKHVRVKHQKVKLFRANEPLLSVFMWGVNHSINELIHVNIPVMLMPDDFRAHSKVRVDNHLFNKENLPSHFKVKEYCPIVFRNLRERFGIDDLEFRESLTSQGSCPSCVGQPEVMSLMLPVLQFIVERRGKTLLPQYLGMFRLNVENVVSYFCVMRNVFSTHLTIHKSTTLTNERSRSGSRAQPTALYNEAATLCDTRSLPSTSKVNISTKNSHHQNNSTYSQQQSKGSRNQPSCLWTGWGSNNIQVVDKIMETPSKINKL
ncbi:Phosphatidylinositol-4-phosphate 5-kinase core [Trinorchestia longiramus]|nr:Phosphatidylinositol-4-phosphate 5-kinase core [Trinorchestia longiramus]